MKNLLDQVGSYQLSKIQQKEILGGGSKPSCGNPSCEYCDTVEEYRNCLDN